jgi:hypothetical protein
MPYSKEAYALAIGAEIERMEKHIRSWKRSTQRWQHDIDAGYRPHLHHDIRLNIERYEQDIKEFQAFIVRREMQVTPLVSSILLSYYVKPFLIGEGSKCMGQYPILLEYDRYMRWEC